MVWIIHLWTNLPLEEVVVSVDWVVEKQISSVASWHWVLPSHNHSSGIHLEGIDEGRGIKLLLKENALHSYLANLNCENSSQNIDILKSEINILNSGLKLPIVSLLWAVK